MPLAGESLTVGACSHGGTMKTISGMEGATGHENNPAAAMWKLEYSSEASFLLGQVEGGANELIGIKSRDGKHMVKCEPS